MTTLKHYLFECIDENSENEGEEFIVGGYTYDEAHEKAKDEFGCVRYICRLTEEEAEASGLDEW